jgi:ABC-type sugar transport system permease subunit
MLNNKQFLWFISPWLIGLVFLTIGPMIFSLYLSFTKWDMLSPIEWVGIENYQEIFSKPEFYASLSATFIWISFLPLGIVIALFLANFLNQQIRFKNIRQYNIIWSSSISRVNLRSMTGTIVSKFRIITTRCPFGCFSFALHSLNII